MVGVVAGVVEETATVVAVEEGFAWVEASRRSACGHCESASTCGAGALAEFFRAGSNRLRVADAIGLQPGERVRIGVSSSTLLRAAAAAYLLPLGLLILAAGLGTLLGLAEGAVAALGVGALLAGLWLGERLAGGHAARQGFDSTLLGRLPGEGPVRVALSPQVTSDGA